jgi:hypothetical protein
MAFNNVGGYWITNGANFWVNLEFGGIGTFAGPIWAMAIPRPFDTFPTPSGTTQLEIRRSQIRFLYQNGGQRWTYWFNVENTPSPGWNATWFGLSGGGN